MRPLAELSLLRAEVAAFTKDLRATANRRSILLGRPMGELIDEDMRMHLCDTHPRQRLIAFAAAVEVCPSLAMDRLNDAHLAAQECPVLRALFWSATRRLRVFGWFSLQGLQAARKAE